MIQEFRVHTLVSSLLVALVCLGMARADSPAYPLKASADGRYLVDQKDVPYLIHGDTPWAIFYAPSDKEAEEFLEDRRLKGFNTMQVVLLPHPAVRTPAWSHARSPVWPFVKPEDLSTPNEKYFAKVDRILRMGAAKGIQFSINPIWLNTWKEIMSSNGLDKVRKYGEYVGKRYKDFDNIIWLEGGDLGADGGDLNGKFQGGQGGVASLKEYLEAFVAGMQTRDRRHLQTVHQIVPSVKDLEQYIAEPWYTLHNVYYYRTIQERALHSLSLKPALPFFLSESCYEGEHLDWNPPGKAWRMRIQAYCAVLCGASGHIVGAAPKLYWFDKGWQTVMNTPMYQTIVHLKSLFDSRPWRLMVPDGNPKHVVVTAGYGKDWDYVPAARANDGSFVIAYLPKPTTITVDMTKLSGGEVRAWWFNPRDGKATLTGTYSNSGSREFTSPSNASEDDWVLVLDDAAKSYPEPGGKR